MPRSHASAPTPRLRRRDFLRWSGALVVGAALAGPAEAEAFDAALARLHRTDLEYGGGLANHGPMAAEALVTLGRADRLPAFLSAYTPRLEPFRLGHVPIAESAWEAALGQGDRGGDWVAFFADQLKAREWREVVGTWVPRLGTGLAAAGAHGLLRTAHATRALASKDSAERRVELAHGLGYWAAHHQPLPTAASPTRWLDPGAALAQMPMLPSERRAKGGSIVRGLEAFAADEGMQRQVAELGVRFEAGRGVSQLTAAAARLHLRHVGGRNTIALLHTVTASSALRLLLPHLPVEEREPLLRRGFDFCAGIAAAFGQVSPGPLPDPARAPIPKAQALVAKALASLDEHAIKMVEACLREHAVEPDPLYLYTAADVLARLT